MTDAITEWKKALIEALGDRPKCNICGYHICEGYGGDDCPGRSDRDD